MQVTFDNAMNFVYSGEDRKVEWILTRRLGATSDSRQLYDYKYTKTFPGFPTTGVWRPNLDDLNKYAVRRRTDSVDDSPLIQKIKELELRFTAKGGRHAHA